MVKLLDWNVFSQTCTLVNVETGEKVKLPPRAMDVLKYLIEKQGQVVSNSELLDRFWSKSVNSDHAVHNAIAELRSTLGDHASNPRYIKTYPKRGYSLIALPCDLDVAGDTRQASPRMHKLSKSLLDWRLAVLAAGLLVMLGVVGLNNRAQIEQAGPDVILVRPFQSINVDADNLFWAEQLPVSLIAHLSKLPDTVIVSEFNDFAAEQYLQSNFQDDLDYVLGGNLQQANDALRLHVNLINLRDKSIVFSEQFDIGAARVFDVHDQVGESVVSALSILLDEDQHQEMQNWGTVNPFAYSHFLEARFYGSNSNHRDLQRAIDHYSKATEEDPAFVNAYFGLVRTASALASYSHDTRIAELYGLISDAIQNVARIDSRHELLIEMRTHLLRLEAGSRPLIEETIRELILTDRATDFAYANYATLLAEARLYDEASQFFKLSGDDRPFQIPRNATWLYQTFFETPADQIQAQKKILLQRPDHLGIMSALIRGLVFVGDYSQAIHFFQRQMDIDKDGPFTMLSQVLISGLAGSSTEAGDQFEQLNADNPDYTLSHGGKSFILGDVGKGIAYWRSLSPADTRRLSIMGHKVELYFPEHVLKDPAYQALLEELGMGISWQRHLMDSLREMSQVTGIGLSPLSTAAYESNVFLSENNLWGHAQIAYPNRDESLSLTMESD